MNVYTTYFGNIRKLPKDIVPVNISRKPPVSYKGLSYLHLAPPFSILKAYRQNKDWEAYREAYTHRVLHTLDPSHVMQDLEKLSGGRDVALVCYEKEPSGCHRSLVTEWFNQAGFAVKEI